MLLKDDKTNFLFCFACSKFWTLSGVCLTVSHNQFCRCLVVKLYMDCRVLPQDLCCWWTTTSKPNSRDYKILHFLVAQFSGPRAAILLNTLIHHFVVVTKSYGFSPEQLACSQSKTPSRFDLQKTQINWEDINFRLYGLSPSITSAPASFFEIWEQGSGVTKWSFSTRLTVYTVHMGCVTLLPKPAISHLLVIADFVLLWWMLLGAASSLSPAGVARVF